LNRNIFIVPISRQRAAPASRTHQAKALKEISSLTIIIAASKIEVMVAAEGN